MQKNKLDLKTGFKCNNSCKFCVQAHKKQFGDKPAEILKAYLKESSRDFKSVVFTGGEITIRKDILELIDYARGCGYKDIILQSNGRMFAYKAFCIKAIEAGANMFAIAIHGHKPELHDYLTTSKGSFAQTYQGLKNLVSLNQSITTNTVITKSNYRHLPEIAKMLALLSVKSSQLAFPHMLGNAMKNYKSVIPKKSLIEPYVKAALDISTKYGARMMTEAIPYCFMNGYEKYVVEKYIPMTKIYDLDFTIENFTEVRKKYGKVKGKMCPACKYNDECEGPWREYPQLFGWSEFKAVN